MSLFLLTWSYGTCSKNKKENWVVSESLGGKKGIFVQFNVFSKETQEA